MDPQVQEAIDAIKKHFDARLNTAVDTLDARLASLEDRVKALEQTPAPTDKPSEPAHGLESRVAALEKHNGWTDFPPPADYIGAQDSGEKAE